MRCAVTLILAFAGAITNVSGYEVSTHREITNSALVVSRFPVLLEHLGIADALRVLNHFYDPVRQRGLFVGKLEKVVDFMRDAEGTWQIESF